MEIVTQLNIVMLNAPSSLAKVGDRLRAADVNINAIACTEGTPKTVIHMILDDTETAKIVLKELGEVSTTQVLAIKVKNKPGAIAEIGRDLAASSINIRNIYSTTCGKGTDAMVYVSVENPQDAMEKMNAWKAKK